MAEEQELPENGKVSAELLREKTDALDVFPEGFTPAKDIAKLIQSQRTLSEILRTKEFVIKWAEKNKLKGKIAMMGVEVDV